MGVVAVQYVWIVLAALGGFVAAWPVAYAWAGRYAIYTAHLIVEREFKTAADAHQALDQLNRKLRSQNSGVEE